MAQHAGPMALTQLVEDEQMFRDTVRRFAVEQIGPLVRSMDESQQMDLGLIKKLFQLGLMGIEIPERVRRRPAGPSSTRSSRSKRSPPSTPPLASWSTCRTRSASTPSSAGQPKSRKRNTSPASPPTPSDPTHSAKPPPAPTPSRSQTRAVKRGDDYILNGQKLWITNAKEAGLFIVFATLDPAAGYKGITAFLVEKDAPGFYPRQEGRQARYPRLQHLRPQSSTTASSPRHKSSANPARATRSPSKP